MHFEDFIQSPAKITTEKWQFGTLIQQELVENSIVLLMVSDYRGGNKKVKHPKFDLLRKELYSLSRLDFQVVVVDLGDLISGKTLQDTHYIVEEIASACHYKKAIPVVVGGGNDLSHALFSALNFHEKNTNYTQISNVVSLSNNGTEINESNYLHRIFSTKNFAIKNFHLLGYQKHLNEEDSVNLVKEVDFDIVRLSEMMNTTSKTEPFFRRTHLATVNCDAVESFGDAFSINPQVNGLNKREICAYMKEIGLSENLKSVGIFNFNFESQHVLNYQLLAQMIWYLVEGINVQRSHPKDRKYETFLVLINDTEYTFKRDIFSNLWYFGNDDNIQNCLPCSREDFENAKHGLLNDRFFK